MKYTVSMRTLYGITGYNSTKSFFFCSHIVASWEYFERFGGICMYSQTGRHINEQSP